LSSLFIAFDEFVQDANVTIQGWFGASAKLESSNSIGQKDSYNKVISERTAIKSVAHELRNQEAQGLPLQLVLFVYAKHILEVTFSGTSKPAAATQLAVSSSSFDDSFLYLFSRFHRNESVRVDQGFAYTAFSEPIGKGFKMLCPIRLLRKPP